MSRPTLPRALVPTGRLAEELQGRLDASHTGAAAEATAPPSPHRDTTAPPRLAALLPTVERLCAVADATTALELALVEGDMNPEARADLRALLVRAAADPDVTRQSVRSLAPLPDAAPRPISLPLPLAVRRRVSAPPTSAAHPGTRWAAAAVVIAATAAGTGVAAASTHALPGDALYGVKRQVEAVHLSLAHGELARGRVLLAQAAARLAETEQLAARSSDRPGPGGPPPTTPGDRALVTSTLHDLGTAWSGSIDELTAAYRRSGDPGPLQVLGRAVRDQQTRLATLSAQLAPADRASAQQLAGQLSSLHAQLDDVLPGDASDPDSGSAGDPVATTLDHAVSSPGVPAGADGPAVTATAPSTTTSTGPATDADPGVTAGSTGVSSPASSDPGTGSTMTAGTPAGGTTGSSGGDAGSLPAPAPLPPAPADPPPAPAPPADPAPAPPVPVTVDPGAVVAGAASGVAAGVASGTGTP